MTVVVDAASQEAAKRRAAAAGSSYNQTRGATSDLKMGITLEVSLLRHVLSYSIIVTFSFFYRRQPIF